MAPATLTEIEACVVALVAVDGPLTPYAIRMDFLTSPNPQWSGSAGTIYPLIERLLRRKLIRATPSRTGRRRSHHISVTLSGLRAVKHWLAVPVPEWVAGVPPDPLRTRLRFLAVLDARQRRIFLRDAHARTRTHLRNIRADCKQRRAKSELEYLMARGALLSMQSRCIFLREVARALRVHL